MTITNDIKYIGVNDHQVDLFEGQYIVPNGISYNSYAIVDEKISAQIDHLEEVTGKIIDHVVAHPKKLPQIRRFMDYYLPTTLKILKAYAQLDAQGVAGENITAAKARIEGMMDKVVEGFENQLDKLFADSAMDISSDVSVLEQMLEKDGLSNRNQGMTL